MDSKHVCIVLMLSALAALVSTTTEDVGVVVNQIVEQHLTGCHLLLITTNHHSRTFIAMRRHLSEAVVVAAEVDDYDIFAQALFGEFNINCHGIILCISNENLSNNTNLSNNVTNDKKVQSTLRLLEQAGLWKLPHAWVVVVGEWTQTRHVLLHPSLRNTINGLYFAIQHHPTNSNLLSIPTRQPQPISFLHRLRSQEEQQVTVYKRCQYCREGTSSVQWLFTSRVNNYLYHYLNTFIPSKVETGNLRGKTLKVVSVPFFPYADFHRDVYLRSDTRVVTKDSLDFRIIEAFAEKLNFTPEIHAEPDRTFGEEMNGKYTGMIGQLQREESDITTIVARTPSRVKVVDFLRTYPSDVLVIISLQPTVLPAHLSIIRPFSGGVWAGILVSVMVWSTTFWVLQLVWRLADVDRRIHFNSIFLYGWGTLMQQPPSVPSTHVSGQMLLGWWLVFCLIIDTGFQSSLVSHLTVQSKTPTIDTLADLVEQYSWRWCTEGWLYKSAVYDYFSKHTDPVVKEIYKRMEVTEVHSALKNVLEGRFSLIDFKNYIKVVVASEYTDSKGNTPFYIGNDGVSVLGEGGFAIRKGASFYSRFVQLMAQLHDAGIVDRWTEEVISQRVKENRAKAKLGSNTDFHEKTGEDNTLISLGLDHMQAAFYLLFISFILATMILITEIFIFS